MPTKISILGCGYVGSAFASNRHLSGDWVTTSTRKPERIEELQVISSEVVLLTSENDWRRLLSSPDALLVAVAPERGSSYEETYLLTAKKLVEIGTDAQIIYLSSTSVLGDCEGDWVDENAPLRPSTPQAQILANTEQRLLDAFGERACVLRLGEIVGPGRELSKRFMNRSTFPGTGENWTNILHLDDLVSGISFAMNQKLSGVYHLCSDLHVQRKALYADLAKKHGLQEPMWDPATFSPHGGNRRVSNEKIKAAGFQFRDIDAWFREM